MKITLLEPIGDPDFALIQIHRQLNGLEPAQMVWVCQHSCPQETIPGCQELNCEAATIVDPVDVAVAQGWAERGEFDIFDRLAVTLKLGEVPAMHVSALNQFCATRNKGPQIHFQNEVPEIRGSLLAFAKMCARRVELGLSEDVKKNILEIERVLTWQFYHLGPILFRSVK
jgi:hypothetical protein